MPGSYAIAAPPRADAGGRQAGEDAGLDMYYMTAYL
jgi:hypothetical protein